MTPDVVVDIGNSRMKWGRVVDGRVAEMVSLPLNDLGAWERQLTSWGLNRPVRWAVASVNPPVASAFQVFANGIDGECLVLHDYRMLPLRVEVDQPERVGIDRLLGAVAAKSLTPPGEPIITVDVGTAVTVNCVEATGAFVGGAIMPGPRLMAAALHQHTAALPDVELDETAAVPIGRNTSDAIRAGIACSIQGGVALLVKRMAFWHPDPWLFFTGGGCRGLANHLIPGCAEVNVVPHLTLEGIRLAAEALP